MKLPIVLNERITKELPADPLAQNIPRQVEQACFSYVTPKSPSAPKLLHVSKDVLHNLGLEGHESTQEFLNIFSGKVQIPHTLPYAMCYGGHQFGHWAGQLGDGRAINLAEVIHNNKTWALQLKGAGVTPYSRSADGLAVLRSSIREYLCSEAMHHLGVPTTRALSLVLSGDSVLRDVLYDGNPAYEPGAIVCRVAESFLRFGSYEIHAARQDYSTLKALVDYTIKNHHLALDIKESATYLEFFKAVTKKSMDMVVHWQRVGFVHGVMNTDNMSILGLTIDYGPYGWLEDYDPNWTPNTTDATNRRYRFGEQPRVVLWNLLKLANALYPLVKEAEPLEEILHTYQKDIEKELLNMMRGKLGLFQALEGDQSLIQDLQQNLQKTETDMTIFFRNLSAFTTEKNALEVVQGAFYNPKDVQGETKKAWEKWFTNYAKRLINEESDPAKRAKYMNSLNPKYVLRNYMAQLAIDEAEKGNYELVHTLFELLKEPYAEQFESEKWFAKRPEWARNKVGCSMLSCSS